MTKDSNQPKGFAGLEDMTSDVDLPELPVRPTKSVATTYSYPPETSTHQPFEIDESRMAQPKRKGMSSPTKWAIGIGVVVVIVIIANLNDKNSSGSYSAPAIYEEMPAQGSGIVLTDSQIRYCLSQDIRLNSWSSVVDHNSQTAIDSFNGAIEDYNSRCSNYKYRRGAIERVRSEVESRRAALQSDGISKAATRR